MGLYCFDVGTLTIYLADRLGSGVTGTTTIDAKTSVFQRLVDAFRVRTAVPVLA